MKKWLYTLVKLSLQAGALMGFGMACAVVARLAASALEYAFRWFSR